VQQQQAPNDELHLQQLNPPWADWHVQIPAQQEAQQLDLNLQLLDQQQQQQQAQ
jgi:hypothetical protein